MPALPPLPTSKAAEIAYRSLRLRLGRSLTVTAGIVLATAFLMSVLATNATTARVRQWAIDRRDQPTAQSALARMRDAGIPRLGDGPASGSGSVPLGWSGSRCLSPSSAFSTPCS